MRFELQKTWLWLRRPPHFDLSVANPDFEARLLVDGWSVNDVSVFQGKL